MAVFVADARRQKYEPGFSLEIIDVAAQCKLPSWPTALHVVDFVAYFCIANASFIDLLFYAA